MLINNEQITNEIMNRTRLTWFVQEPMQAQPVKRVTNQQNQFAKSKIANSKEYGKNKINKSTDVNTKKKFT